MGHLLVLDVLGMPRFIAVVLTHAVTSQVGQDPMATNWVHVI